MTTVKEKAPLIKTNKHLRRYLKINVFLNEKCIFGISRILKFQNFDAWLRCERARARA